ncbi:transglycosylase SLT domain-containing protein [Microvirga guangxiensis]|uniref:Transglycosylase SLT domain-containing protein n=1 Tax=Microvirga guangxiensis TaxID=549386 RepID=A0A1G5LKH3_9HYPH|nr:transglycosylase SLT domain-containing protein [Microvirga guangxiensis]SCZ13134.1 Transglycosylase SLT domain-containing protein [Microvirga guangxiensis]
MPSGKRKSLLNAAASMGLLTCIVAGAPAVAATSQKHAAPSSNMAPKPMASQSSTDPLENIAPVTAAETPTYAELLELFITSMPLTNPPAAEGDTDDDIDVTPVEYMEFEEMRVPVWIVDTILRASEVTGADPVYMMALADKESSFLPGNKAATSSAVGLFQFISSTWLEAVRSFGPKHGLIMEAASIEKQGIKLSVADERKREYILGLRRNPFISALMAAEMMQRDKMKIETRLGRKLSRSEFYLSHFFGVDSASRFIALVDDTPKKSAKSAFPRAAKSNKSLFYATEGKKSRQLSVSEVYDKIDTMIDKRLNRYEDVSSRVTADAGL